MKRLTAAMLATISLNASAFFDAPQIVPAQPLSDSPVSVRIRGGVCDTFATDGPMDREVEVIGNRIIVRFVGVSTDDEAQCIFPVGTAIYTIGLLPAGTYEAEVYVRQFFFPTQLTLIGTTSFTVAQRNLVVIPTTGRAALGLMVLGLSVLSVGALRRSTA